LLGKHYQHTVAKHGQCGGDQYVISSKVDTVTDISVTASDNRANKNPKWPLPHTKKLEIILKKMSYDMATSA